MSFAFGNGPPSPYMNANPMAPPMFSQGQGMGPPQAPPMFSQGMPQGPRPPMAGQAMPQPGQQPQLSPEMMKSILGGGAQAEMAQIGQQRKLADMMRSGAESQLEGKQIGKQYFAPGWGNVAASVGLQGMGAYQDSKADQRTTDLGARQGQQAADWFEAVTGKKMPQAPGAAAGGAAGGGGFMDMLKSLFGGSTAGGASIGGAG